MSLAELVITSVKLEGRTKSEVACDYKTSRYWVQQLVKRYEAEGEAAFQQHSRRPRHNSRAISADLEDGIVRLRKELSKKDQGPGQHVFGGVRRTARGCPGPAAQPAVSSDAFLVGHVLVPRL